MNQQKLKNLNLKLNDEVFSFTMGWGTVVGVSEKCVQVHYKLYEVESPDFFNQTYSYGLDGRRDQVETYPEIYPVSPEARVLHQICTGTYERLQLVQSDQQIEKYLYDKIKLQKRTISVLHDLIKELSVKLANQKKSDGFNNLTKTQETT